MKKLYITALCAIFAGSASAAPKELPKFSAETLAEKPITLPQESPSELTLMIFAYQREHQPLVDNALEQLEPLFQNYAPNQIDYIEVPTIENYGALFRMYVDGAMRSGIVEEYKRDRVVTYYTDMEEYKSRYEVEDLSTITTLLVSRDGTIHWRHSGPVDGAKAAKLQRTATQILENKPSKKQVSAL